MKRLSPKEEEIMRMFWSKGPMFVRDLLELYNEPKPHYNTVSTLVRGLEEKENIKVYTLPGGSHRTRIGSFDKKTQEEIMTLINRWLKE